MLPYRLLSVPRGKILNLLQILLLLIDFKRTRVIRNRFIVSADRVVGGTTVKIRVRVQGILLNHSSEISNSLSKLQ